MIDFAVNTYPIEGIQCKISNSLLQSDVYPMAIRYAHCTQVKVLPYLITINVVIMSFKHTEEFKISRLGEGNPNWNGGRHIDTKGYIRVLNPEHKYADNKGYVKEHKLVWYTHNGDIPDGYCVHHKNGNKKDNKIDNLVLMLISDHSKLHFKNNKFGQKYSEFVVVNWVNLHYDGLTYEKISTKVNVDKTTVFRKVKEFKNKYPKPQWAYKQLFRASGLLEDLCKDNSIGHPNDTWLQKHDPTGQKMFGVHGCDGCCKE